jgi:hypothetical protein
MQSLRDKESDWTKTAQEGKVVIEDVIRVAEQLPPEVRHQLSTQALRQFYEDLDKWSGEKMLN